MQRTRLSREKRAAIRDALEEGDAPADVAAHFGVPEAYIQNIVANMKSRGEGYRPSELRILIEKIKLQAEWDKDPTGATRYRHLTIKPQPVEVAEAVSTFGIKRAERRVDRRRAGREG